MYGKYPVTYQELSEYSEKRPSDPLFNLRKETIQQIEQVTGRPLICYVAKTHNIPKDLPTFIDDADLVGFSDLISTTDTDDVDVFIVSNGGSPEAADRIVRLVRSRYKKVRFLVAGNAYSAATIICFSGDEIVMHAQGTLGPIDPQINGIPAYAILKSFEQVERRLKDEGPSSLTAYMPLIAKYDLHLFEICRNAQKLSQELAEQFLAQFMLKDPERVELIPSIVEFFMNQELHKSHGRSIDRATAPSKGLTIANAEGTKGLNFLMLSLFNQYEQAMDKSPFYKYFENVRGINWGRLASSVAMQVPNIPQIIPQPGPPQRSQSV